MILFPELEFPTAIQLANVGYTQKQSSKTKLKNVLERLSKILVYRSRVGTKSYELTSVGNNYVTVKDELGGSPIERTYEVDGFEDLIKFLEVKGFIVEKLDNKLVISWD